METFSTRSRNENVILPKSVIFQCALGLVGMHHGIKKNATIVFSVPENGRIMSFLYSVILKKCMFSTIENLVSNMVQSELSENLPLMQV